MSQASKERNKRVVEQLGMPFGTATARLRKSILFQLLKKLKENVCFKCGEEILVIGDLSIEHKQPWENRDPKLFWDLDNIAFSHLRCNIQHNHNGSGTFLRKIGPYGMSWCTVCQDFLSNDLFYKNSSRWNGLSFNCKNCHDRQQNHGTIRGRVSGGDSSNC